MTDHGLTGTIKSRSAILEGKPHYRFWAIPEFLEEPAKGRKSSLFYYLGAGYIAKEDHVAVDSHLTSILNQAERLVQAH